MTNVTESDITYNGNDKETYDLCVKGEVVAEILTGEDGAIELVQHIQGMLWGLPTERLNVVIQNDGDKLGIIVDTYDGEDWIGGTTFWFEDYSD